MCEPGRSPWTAAALVVFLHAALIAGVRADPLPGGTLDPTTIPKFVEPLVVPPAMPPSESDAGVTYQIAVREFRQQVLPPGLPMTTVWSYGSIDHPGTVAEGGSFHYPAFTIEADVGQAVTVKWVNDLKDPETGTFRPHLLALDQTLHWANPTGNCVEDTTATSDCRGHAPGRYRGPVPMVVHLHGGDTGEESDGYPEAWYLPDAVNIPDAYATHGRRYADITGTDYDVPGQAIFRYPNDQAATTLWYHDHTLGMTRLNVYAGPAGFYLLRGGAGDLAAGPLPGPAPGVGADPFATWYEVPIVIQDRSFNGDGSLFYPATRAFFDGFRGPPEPGSDVPHVWNPEFFGNTIVVNGRTWPYLEVEPRRYRLRLLNGSGARFLILTTEGEDGGPGLTFWTIGGDGGFLPAPVERTHLLLGPAERADTVVDFSGLAAGTEVTLLNVGPDEPFGGGSPGEDFPPADPGTTGQVMQFRVVALASPDTSTPPAELALPAPPALGPESRTRALSLNEEDSRMLCVSRQGGTVPCGSSAAVDAFGPVRALLGTMDGDASPIPLLWDDAVTENPDLGATEVWELYNFTADAHPIHVHLVQFEVVNRQSLAGDDGMAEPPARLTGDPRGPEPWETGRKDTVIAYPGEVTRVKARFDRAGLYVWHCHILEHEDNEMMRPLRVGP
jgi:FtsP/CotA-like multicopper oxidase with cupredoxin domain